MELLRVRHAAGSQEVQGVSSLLMDYLILLSHSISITKQEEGINETFQIMILQITVFLTIRVFLIKNLKKEEADKDIA